MEPRGSLPYSQFLGTVPYPESVGSNPQPVSLEPILIKLYYLRLVLSSRLFTQCEIQHITKCYTERHLRAGFNDEFERTE
jgi:hypothetical protein